MMCILIILRSASIESIMNFSLMMTVFFFMMSKIIKKAC